MLKQAFVLLWCCALIVSVAPAAGQETVNFASLSGRVTDPQGAVVADARVTARHAETNATAEAATDQDGRFRFSYLRIGAYDVVVRVPGFAEFIYALTLTAGGAFDVPVMLSIGGIDTQVIVTSQATVLEASRSQIAATVTQRELDNLPLNGRQFLDLALLVPGVSPPNVGGGTQLFAETSAVPGVGLSIASQRNLSNNFILDGLSANDDAAALTGMPVGVDAIEQVQVVTSGGQAELGRALGGYVNVVTRSGTNRLRGTAYGYFRDDRFNAANALSGTRLPMNQQQYGASIGGPVRRDRTFYFVNVEQRDLEQTGLATISQANVDAVNARLAQAAYPGAKIATGIYPNPVRSLHLLGRMDHQFSGSDQLSVRFSLYDVAADNSRGAGALNAPTASAGLDNRDQTIAVGNTRTISSRMVNETRGQVSRGNLKALPTDPVGPAVSIAGVASFGTLSGSPIGRVNSLYQVVNNLSYLAGPHALRAGVDVIYNDDTVTYPRSIRGTYTFASLAAFQAGTYNSAGFTQTFGETVVSQTNPNVGLYVQDEWKARPSVTLNLGLRHDLQFLDTIETDRNNVSPRVGLAWAPSGSTRTIVRGGAGLYFDRVPLRALANALLSAGNTTDLANLRQIGISLSPTQAGAPVFPNILPAAVPSVTRVNLATMDRRMQNAYSRQASLEVERQIGRQATVSAGYQHVRGLNLIMSVNQNVPTCVATGTNNGCRPNSSYANNSQYSSVGRSSYHGLLLSLVQRPGEWGNYRVSYALSTSKNNLGEAFFSSPIDPADLSKDWGRSDGDQRHRLVISGAINSPTAAATTPWEHVTHGFQASAMVQYASALPFNITSGLTTVQGTQARPVVNGAFIKRNAGVGSDSATINLRVSRTFRAGGAQLEGLVEAFNLANRRNNLTRNTNFGAGSYPASPSSSFNQITAVGEPRTFQFAVRARF